MDSFRHSQQEHFGSSDPKDAPITAGQGKILNMEPDCLEGVASAYRYKLSIKNETLCGATFNFLECMDVFSFSAVDKKRALKKEEWPSPGSLNNPNRFDVKVQLLAGNVEIETCDGCASWKEKTRKPFLILTPTGERCVQYSKNPFLLLIFRCCPKFHSCNKQFRLFITIQSPFTGEIYQNEVNIYRKKMVSNKKRKMDIGTPTVDNSTMVNPPVPSPIIMARVEQPPIFPKFPYSKAPTLPPVVSPQMMYELLYSDHKESKQIQQMTSEICRFLPNIPPPPRMEPTRYQSFPIVKQEPMESGCFVVPNKIIHKGTPTFWNFDTYPNSLSHPGSIDANNDEKWLDSVFSELNGSPNFNLSHPRSLDYLSILLDLPPADDDIDYS